MSNITLTRRQNTLILFQAFAQQAQAGGALSKGLEQAFAAKLEMSPSMWSQIKASRPISERLARQIESICGKPQGWLDESTEEEAEPNAAEKAFLELALAAWRATNAAGRKALKDHMALIAEPST